MVRLRSLLYREDQLDTAGALRRAARLRGRVHGGPTELLLYPNPTNGDQVRIQLSGIDPEITTATLDITDLFGKRVMSTTLPLNDGALNTSLALPVLWPMASTSSPSLPGSSSSLSG
ncbi:MAG: T9SS type A sorting domain-containing protein [Flavobacteriales bacterium]|nr:T9SS type A sorting domain-containing protein [Flavobacteriales bacterium]